VVSVSQRVAAELMRFAPDKLVTVLPSPLDLTRFVPLDRKEAKNILGFPNCTEKWILFNSLDLQNPIKRYGLAKQAFEIAKARHGNLRLRLATDLPHDVLPLFVASCDLIVCTSENEGWPNSVKEALACNVPFVSTDVSDLRDIASIEPSCRICPPDPQVIADNIGDVLAGPEPRDLRKYVSGMGLDAAGDKLISIYGSVLAQYRRPGGVTSSSEWPG
jgi:glycosyltransferase involved in cell wall biosynthesis